MGYGTTLTPLLLLIGLDPLNIVPAVLLSELMTGLAAGIMHHRDGNIDLIGDPQARYTLWLLAALSTLGAASAALVAIRLPGPWLTLTIAVIILAMGAITLLTARRRICYRVEGILALGLVAAFNKGLSGGGYGPLVTRCTASPVVEGGEG
ncbi:TSUP family transporter [Caldichromatium japonicum]|uniref:Probable membrane transporter protein n=1 Tax=Caldichromatium japonicum TaxID=2699430 RepID=A0A6G7VC68_9GAMM|nr:sulfite exporter TauE/SafE family protein [Caldichromatium japonicum]QIK37673.1 TSUP family transporter [Caldichromatium japonicum]